MFRANSLTEATARICAAVSRQDAGALRKAYGGLRKAVIAAGEPERAAAVGGLVPALEGVPVRYGGDLAQMTGAMVGMEGDPAPVLDVLARRACGVMEDAVVFADAWRTLNGPMPSRQRESLDAVAARYPQLAPFLVGLLRTLDDEKLAVLHRESGRGFWVVVSGVADNFQLHTLLAGALLAPGNGGGTGYLPGLRPTAAMIAAADGTGDLVPPDGITGQFTMVDAHGEWIWNEARPGDIPVVNGHRVIVLDPPPCERAWNAGRAYPFLMATVTVEPMTDVVAAGWMALVRPAAPPPASTEMVITDDLRVGIPAGRTVADVVNLVLSRAAEGRPAAEIQAALVTELA